MNSFQILSMKTLTSSALLPSFCLCRCLRIIHHTSFCDFLSLTHHQLLWMVDARYLNLPTFTSPSCLPLIHTYILSCFNKQHVHCKSYNLVTQSTNPAGETCGRRGALCSMKVRAYIIIIIIKSLIYTR